MKPVDAKAYLVQTRLGPMAVCCRGEALVGSILPCDSLDEITAHVWQQWEMELEPEAPALVVGLQDRIERLWGARVSDTFADVALDLGSSTIFQQSVYRELRRLPPGEVLSYGELAQRLGKPGAARAVGSALRCNPLPLFVPCHRVLAKQSLGGFTAPGGLAQKYVLLRAEGTFLSK